jgi:hypothetical protein
MYTWWKKLDKNTKKEYLLIGSASGFGALVAIVTYEKTMGLRGYKMVIPITKEGSDVLQFMDRKGRIWNAKP